jgi:two-component system phosphate regulon sensor histidine kinase PhoR
VRLGAVLLAASAMSAAPAVVLMALAILGLCPFDAALLGAAIVFGAAVVLAALWSRDLETLTETVQLAAADEPARLFVVRGALALPAHAQLTRAIERLARTTATRGALVGRLQRADASVVEHLPDPLFVLAADRSVRRANAAARMAFGDDTAAVLRHPGLRAAIDKAFARGTSQQAELTLPVPVARDLLATVLVLDPPLADGGQAMIVLSDRTRERAVERTRADFVANASHELRTPLASVLGFIETLQGPAADDPPAQQRFLRIMADQATRMNRIIDDLLSLSRIELVEHQAPSERVDLAALVPRIAAAYEPRLKERRQTLAVSIAPGLGAVTADADQIAQVLHNLLDNAVKYGREAGTIRLGVQAPQAGGRWPARPGAVLAVTDDGAGIPREHIPRLTERFYRVDTGRSRAVGGTGLGLAIVKHIVNRHRGQLVIESEPGTGTTVSVWLPYAPAG